MPLLDHLHNDEMGRLEFALAANDRTAAAGIINEIIWRRLATIWDKKVASFWVFKTWRVRDLRWLWVLILGEPPAGLGV